jgi:hypothetical protein
MTTATKTLEEVLDLLVFGRAGIVRVVSKNGKYDETHEQFRKEGNHLVICNDSGPRWFFELSQVVEIKNNYILVHAPDDCAEDFYELHFFEKHPLKLQFEVSS